MTRAPHCHHLKIRASYPGQHCTQKVVYTDPQGRGWCKTHEPDEERKRLWARLTCWSNMAVWPELEGLLSQFMSYVTEGGRKGFEAPPEKNLERTWLQAAKLLEARGEIKILERKGRPVAYLKGRGPP